MKSKFSVKGCAQFLRSRTNSVRVRLRILLGQERVLPQFLIIGAQKAGTSSLFHWLLNHPQIYAPLKKEIHFFDGHFSDDLDTLNRGESWYRAHFPMKWRMGDRRALTFEATPSYLFHPDAPGRIRTLLPNVRHIVLLRNPTERAISHYFHERSRGTETLSIEEAFQIEDQRLEAQCNGGASDEYALQHFSYKARGLYHFQIERFFAWFERCQFLFLSSEEMFSHPIETLQIVCKFLEIEPYPGSVDLPAKNVGSNKGQVADAVYRSLDRHFDGPNSRLFELIDRQFNWTREIDF